jgi:hypothetical protein
MPDYIKHFGRIAEDSVTRPANTTAYTAGDVVTESTADALEFLGDEQRIGVNIIHSAVCISSANQGTKPDLELWLFDADLTPADDNAAFAPTDAQMRTLVGVIEFPVASFKVGNSGSGADGNVACEVQDLDIVFSPKAAGGMLYGVLVVRNAYTPVSAERFDIRLGIVE